MTTAKEDFKKWFVDPLAGLKENGHAGFILLLVAFPLLERYLRNKSGCPEGNVTGKFHSILEVLFRDIAGKGGLFWNCYRHGLLHQATFNIEKKQKRDDGEIVISILPAAGISGYDPRPVYFIPDANRFYLNPVAFFDLVTKTILGDFSTYERSGTHNKLPQALVDSLLGETVTIVPTICIPAITPTSVNKP